MTLKADSPNMVKVRELHSSFAIKGNSFFFVVGDTIGIGMLYDSFNQRKLFMTKNGQMIRKSSLVYRHFKKGNFLI